MMLIKVDQIEIWLHEIKKNKEEKRQEETEADGAQV